jgi:hypothetical protein
VVPREIKMSPRSFTSFLVGNVCGDTCGHVGSCWTTLSRSKPGSTPSKSSRGGPFLPVHGFDQFADSILQALHSCAQSEFGLTVAVLLDGDDS